MAITYEEKLSQSPLVAFVFQTEDLIDGVYIASADARWDIIFSKCPDGNQRVLLCGPSFETRQVPCSPGYKPVGICYRPWAIFAGVPITTMLNETKLSPMLSPDTFIMQGKTWKMPTYENIDQFVAEQENRGLLEADPIIRDILENKPVDMSLRSVQRHFVKTIGMSPRRVRQINSARKAVQLLQQGNTLSEVAYELDYADSKVNATKPGIHTVDA
jgi:AraC-type DNA-binding domain-containing proteins